MLASRATGHMIRKTANTRAEGKRGKLIEMPGKCNEIRGSTCKRHSMFASSNLIYLETFDES